MSCKFTINYAKPKDILVSKLKDAIEKTNGQFSGDASGGTFKGQTPIGGFSGSYEVQGDDIHVNIEDKPFLIGCSRIEKEIRDYLG